MIKLPPASRPAGKFLTRFDVDLAIGCKAENAMFYIAASAYTACVNTAFHS